MIGGCPPIDAGSCWRSFSSRGIDAGAGVGVVDLGEPPLPGGEVARLLDADRRLHERLDRAPAVADHLPAGGAVAAGDEADVVAAGVGGPAGVPVAAEDVVHAAEVVVVAE